MKSLILLALPLTLSAQELENGFKGPTNEDLMNISFNFLEESQKAVAQTKKGRGEEDCDNNGAPKKVVEAPKPTTNEIVCLCELSPEQQGLLYSLIGEKKSTGLKLTNGNDNFLHGVFQLNSDLAKIDGDDRGRTVNFGGEYKVTGTKGSLELKVDSTGFGKFDRSSGYSRDSEGKYFLNFHEKNTLDLRYDLFGDQKTDGKNSSKNYSLFEFNLTHETDKGRLSKELQDWWHNFNRNQLGMNIIRYNYVKEQPDSTSVRLMAGIGKEWLTNIGNWTCLTKAEIKGGMTLTKSSATPEIGVKGESTLTHKSAPWIALSAWAQASAGYSGKAYEGGLMMSFPIKKKDYIIEPFIGIERHRTALDTKYGNPGKQYENYHVFGVTIRY